MGKRAGRGLWIAGTLYLLLPLCIFCGGFLRWYWAAILLPVLGVSFFLALRHSPEGTFPSVDRRGVWTLLAGLAVIAGITVLSGVGGCVWQNQDHLWRNRIFTELVEKPWPVTGVNEAGEPMALTYYIGFWLPAALMGKLLGLRAGYACMALWCALGMGIAFCLLCAWRGKICLWPLLVFLLFSGLDLAGALYTKGVWGDLFTFEPSFQWGMHLDTWAVIQYPSPMTNLFWSYQQTVPMWVLCLLLLQERDGGSMAFLSAPALLSSAMMVTGLIPVALTLALTRAGGDPVFRRPMENPAGRSQRARAILSPQNLLGGVLPGLLLYGYLAGNVAGGKLSLNGNLLSPLGGTLLLAAYLLEFGLYGALLVKTEGRNLLLPVLMGTLLAAPWILLGNSTDFLMRASMAPLTFLSLLVIHTLSLPRDGSRGTRLRRGALIAALCIGAATPAMEMLRPLLHPAASYPPETVTAEQLYESENFIGPIDGTVSSIFIAYPKEDFS